MGEICLPYFGVCPSNHSLASSDWLTLSVLAIFAVVVIYSSFYALAYAFAMERWKRMIKAELLDVLATLVLVAFIVALLGFVSDLIFQNIIGEKSYVVCKSKIPMKSISSGWDIVRCRILERAYPLAKEHKKVYEAARGLFAELYKEWGMFGVPFYIGKFNNALYYKIENYRLLNEMITRLLIALNSMMVVANYLAENALLSFIPLGLLLRSFRITKSLGALFLSLGVGFFIIFPVVFVLLDPGFVRITVKEEGGLLQPKTFCCFPLFSGFSTSFTQRSQEPVVVVGAPGGGLMTSGGLDLLNAVYFSLLTHFFVSLAITIIFVRYIMYLFGGESMTLMRFVGRVV